jgi:pSer/pThr/pTyr-binding forkhead associated (FHA) protein
MLHRGELALESGELAWRVVLQEGDQVLGRDPDVALHLPLAVVSRRQLRLACQADGCRAENLSQTNPTYLNGQPLSASMPLRDGDLLGVGHLRLRYRAPAADGAAVYGRLLIRQAGRAERAELLAAAQVTIGRDTGCDIVLDYPAISRRHLRLEWLPDAGWRAVDLNSSHGTVVDGRRIDRPAPLPPYGRIWLGDALGNGVILEYVPDGESATQEKTDP